MATRGVLDRQSSFCLPPTQGSDRDAKRCGCFTDADQSVHETRLVQFCSELLKLIKALANAAPVLGSSSVLLK
jgi:hypothetical protein